VIRKFDLMKISQYNNGMNKTERFQHVVLKVGVACRYNTLLPHIQRLGPYEDSCLSFLLQISSPKAANFEWTIFSTSFNFRVFRQFSACHLGSSVLHVDTFPSCLTFNKWVLTETPASHSCFRSAHKITAKQMTVFQCVIWKARCRM